MPPPSLLGNYLMLTGYVCGGWQMARAALVAKAKLDAGEDPWIPWRQTTPRASPPSRSCPRRMLCSR